MRRVRGALTALVLSGAIFAASAETGTAEDKADVARVEQEIRTVDEAMAIHKRARERAAKAVRLSSLGQEYRRAQAKYKKMMSGEPVEGIRSQIHDRARVYAEKYVAFVKRMTRIFLNDEIERATEKKLDGLMRELKKIRSKDYASI
ncbi:MAG: hypothetical protein OXC28_04140 [Defluviicoccus sp.]|nr:hypothetical protein [Defluviicoccus sp.]